MRSRCRCSMCSAIHINSRNWLRSSSTHEPSDPPLKVVFSFASYCYDFKSNQKDCEVKRQKRPPTSDEGAAVFEGGRRACDSLNLAGWSSRRGLEGPRRRCPEKTEVERSAQRKPEHGSQSPLLKPVDPANLERETASRHRGSRRGQTGTPKQGSGRGQSEPGSS